MLPNAAVSEGVSAAAEAAAGALAAAGAVNGTLAVEAAVTAAAMTPNAGASAEPGTEAMEVDAAQPEAARPHATQAGATPAPATPAKATSPAGAGSEGGALAENIAGATPGKHSDPQFRCVYPPTESAQSLIVEHFGFLPISFIDEIINAANDTIYRATDALCKFVEQEQGSGEATSQAINKVETLLEHAVDKNFDKFELYALRNLFNVPRGLEDYIVMPHRSADATGGPAVFAEDEAELDRELEEVRRELVTSNLLRTRLQHDTAKVERSVRRQRALNEHLHINELTQKVLKDTAPATVAGVRAQIGKVARLVEQLDSAAAAATEHPSAMDVLKEPSGRDVYLARMADVQVAGWDARQAQAQAQPN
ncbi:hypothetical protein LPJ61_003269 [Coemansia biformis]|uniref:Mis12-domain-containing protein n=1 Tax=Coemansia biformis TaxID=1286918 RepID=A0A9W7YDC7_9FUNG|nr:hypothetical protein LPJ61_003269 [Coemansia biformis]